MSHRFGSIENSRTITSRERLFCVAGGAFALILAATAALIQSHFTQVEAIKSFEPPVSADAVLDFGTIELLAPAQRVPYGAPLDSVEFRPITWPRTEVPQGAVRNRSSLIGRYAKVDLPPGQPVRDNSLSDSPLLGGIADSIPKSYRATTIAVDSTAGVEGWARPGAHVDVVLTFHDRTDGEKKAKIVVEDAVVKSFNGQTQNRFEGRREERLKMNGTATVTLVSPVRDALTIQAATAMGKISLLLRNSGDIGSVGEMTVAGVELKTKQSNLKQTLSDKGFARFSDDSCTRKEFTLRSDGRWYATGEDCLR